MNGQGQHPDTDKTEAQVSGSQPAAAQPADERPADGGSGGGLAAAEQAPVASGQAPSALVDDAVVDPAEEPAGKAAEGPAGDAAGDVVGREAPPLGGRIHYLLGGTLPPRYSAWVSHDLTGPGWRYRQALRPFFLMLPFAVVFALLPGQVGVRVTIVVFLLLSGVGLGLATSGYFRNRRLEQHNFPPVFPPSD
ncbi:hypothetical protein CC117_25045 [Parafrankia colletiae]|uniref:Uncharacterized protein n=1 Tax=Parafrankia colletiae TaxID=573497 RepID=A0A1S1QGH3_9ACTN|nr:DUF5313 family protein [Parafrankia colletiae]MCK9902724.1 DUF5313 domain-containing protein [Frankia sp. Cpl3]OHV32345.1 hypothetical protein CC117_25045 [Parafrankia colletiae]